MSAGPSDIIALDQVFMPSDDRIKAGDAGKRSEAQWGERRSAVCANTLCDLASFKNSAYNRRIRWII